MSFLKKILPVGAGGFVFFLLLADPGAAFAKFIQLDFALDVKSRFSDGCSTIQELSGLAEQRGLDGLVLGDHDRKVLEYGIFPLERIIKKMEEQPSILSSGATGYLSVINQNDKASDDLMVMAGVESAPFYYWTGSWLEKNLVAHNWDKHLLVIGLPSARDYEQLPILHGSLSVRYLERFMTPFLVSCVAVLVGLWMFYKKKYPKVGLILAGLAMLLSINLHPFRSSPFDAYHGDPGSEPYQHLIDYAREKGALVFWNHLETPTAMGRGGAAMKLETKPHPGDLLETKGYTGFQAVGSKPVMAIQPGREWDQVLLQYLKGQRDWPVWGIGTDDYHCEGRDGRQMGGVRTIVLVRSKDSVATQEAMRAGRMYAVKQSSPESRLSLDEFVLVDTGTGQTATLGEELVTESVPELHLQVRSTAGTEKTAQLTLIRDGKVVKEIPASLPYEFRWRDTGLKPEGFHYYRMRVQSGPNHELVTNPLFVRFGSAGPQVAAVPEPPPEAQPVLAPASPQKPVVPEAPPAPAPVPPKTDLTKMARIEPPKIPAAQKPAPVKTPPVPPVAATPEAPPVPAPKQAEPVPAPAPPAEKATVQVVARIDNLSLRKGPSARFPEVAKAKKGERLDLVRRTTVLFQNKAWLVVRKDGKLAYVWEGFVTGP